MTDLIPGKEYLIFFHDKYWNRDLWDVASYWRDDLFQTDCMCISAEQVKEYYLLSNVLSKIRTGETS